MCGIAGVLFERGQTLRAAWPAPPLAAQLARTLAHRGPDGSGTFVDDGVLLVHTRLALNDLANGAQPLFTLDGRHVLIVNGELYDRTALEARLLARGAQLRTRSDSELLLWVLALDGAEGLAQVEGEYAFCFWDRHTRRALLGRDPVGVKPLVITRHEGALWFASELKALLAVLPGRRVLSREAVAEALVAPALSGVGQLPFAGFENLPAGALLEVTAAGSRVVAQRSFRFRTEAHTLVGLQALHDALALATRERMVADVEVGAFLSGGVDSSALVALGREQGRTRRCHTIRFDHHVGAAPVTHAEGSIVLGDDAPFVERLAAHWPIVLTRVHASRAALLDELDGLVATQDRLVAWEQELSQRFLARAAARELKAVVVGDAADETHFGYAFALSAEVCASPRALLGRFGFELRRMLLQPALRPAVDALDEQYRALSAAHGTPYSGALRDDRLATSSLLVQRWLPRLLHNGDIHTMAFGLEARVPFADTRVLALGQQVAVEDAFTPFLGLPEKAFLRRAVAPLLPSEISARPKSALPRDDGMGPLFQARLRTLLQQPNTRERLADWLDLSALDGLVGGQRAPDDTLRACLFTVLSFESFLRQHTS